MKALFYADWCTLRKSLVSNLAVVLLIVTPSVLLSTANADGVEPAPGIMVTTMIISMLAFFAVINVFAADETGEWEKMRLTFPFSKAEVVRSRYLFLVVSTFTLAIVGAVVGAFAQLVIPVIHGAPVVTRGLGIIFAAALGAAILVLVCFSLSMPVVFRFGVARARIAFSMPFLLISLLAIDPVRDLFLSIVNALESLEHALGTPVPLFIGAIAIAAAMYLISMNVSMGIYEERDF